MCFMAGVLVYGVGGAIEMVGSVEAFLGARL
jgi:hypothetical protein